MKFKKIYFLPLGILIITFIVGFFVWQNLGKRAKNIPQATPIQNIINNLKPEDKKDVPLVSTVAGGLDTPWALAFTPDGEILVTERPGRLRIIDKQGNLNPNAINIEGVSEVGEGGLLGLALHPKYLDNHFIYLYYTSQNNGRISNQVVRYRMNGFIITDRKVIIENIPGASIHDGGRIKFGPDGYLYITAGDASQAQLAQDKNSLAGKILRLTDEGDIPDDNPFPGSPVYSYGHRNPQGLAWDANRRLWELEHGQSATDELNLIEAGKNYGWPTIRGDEKQSGMESPIIHSGSDTWAPSGVAFYKDSAFYGGLRGKSLFQAVISGRNATLKRHFKDEFGRIRDVVLGQDGFLYATTSNRDSRGIPAQNDDQIIRINPEKL